MGTALGFTDPALMYWSEQPNPEILSLLRKPLQYSVWLYTLAAVFAFSALSAGLWGRDGLSDSPTASEKIFYGISSFFKSFWTIGWADSLWQHSVNTNHLDSLSHQRSSLSATSL